VPIDGGKIAGAVGQEDPTQLIEERGGVVQVLQHLRTMDVPSDMATRS